jgi:hypothetical protein
LIRSLGFIFCDFLSSRGCQCLADCQHLTCDCLANSASHPWQWHSALERSPRRIWWSARSNTRYDLVAICAKTKYICIHSWITRVPMWPDKGLIFRCQFRCFFGLEHKI